MKLKRSFENQLSQNVNTHLMLKDLSPEIDRAVKIIYKKIRLGGKLLFCGNGGSAADAQHLAAEYLVRLKPKVNRRPLPALSLAQDTSTLTACGNDYDFSDIFLRFVTGISSFHGQVLAFANLSRILFKNFPRNLKTFTWEKTTQYQHNNVISAPTGLKATTFKNPTSVD